MGHAHVRRGIVRKQHRDGGPRRIWNGVAFEPIEADEQVVPVGAKHAPRFLMRADLVRVNITPNWQTTRSKRSSSNGRSCASTGWKDTQAERRFCAATSNITGFTSVATISACGAARWSARVTMPVPAAVSRIRFGWRRAARAARTFA